MATHLETKERGIAGAFLIGAGYLFVLLLPFLLITTTLRYAINEVRLYEYGFNKYEVVLSTGIGEVELRRAAWALIDYFNSSTEWVKVEVLREGQRFNLFNDREVTHLKDVKGLIQLVYRVQEGSLVYGVAYIVFGYWLKKKDFTKPLARFTLGGSALTIFLLVTLGLASLLDFGGIFLQFHLLSFTNELWMLDPSRDYLIRMFPEGFFQDATLFIALASLVEAALLAALAVALLRRVGVRLKLTASVESKKG